MPKYSAIFHTSSMIEIIPNQSKKKIEPLLLIKYSKNSEMKKKLKELFQSVAQKGLKGTSMENYKDLVIYRVFKIDQGQLFSTQNSKSNVYNVLTFTKIQLQYFAQALEIIRRCKHNMQQMLQKLPFSQISVKIGEMSQHLGTNRELHDSVFWWLFICNSQYYFPGTFQTKILYKYNSMY